MKQIWAVVERDIKARQAQNYFKRVRSLLANFPYQSQPIRFLWCSLVTWLHYQCSIVCKFYPWFREVLKDFPYYLDMDNLNWNFLLFQLYLVMKAMPVSVILLDAFHVSTILSCRGCRQTNKQCWCPPALADWAGRTTSSSFQWNFQELTKTESPTLWLKLLLSAGVGVGTLLSLAERWTGAEDKKSPVNLCSLETSWKLGSRSPIQLGNRYCVAIYIYRRANGSIHWLK